MIKTEIVTNAALRLGVAAADVANYLDHSEHVETCTPGVVRQAGEELRVVGIELSWAADADAFDLYASRLSMIESRNVLSHETSFDGSMQARRAETWRDLQLVQIEHDRFYHPDVIGLAKWQQLNHYLLHMVKLIGATAAVAREDGPSDEWLQRRVPDILLFGIKLATVSGERLPDMPLPRKVASDASTRNARAVSS